MTGITDFAGLEWIPHAADMGGVMARTFFDNGYGASVVQFPGSYGADRGLYELAVLVGHPERWSICYTTPITDDVEGYLSENAVSELLARIKALPADE